MYINELMKKKKMTMYRLSKQSGVPYATVNDICSGKAEILKCSVETIYRLSCVLEVTVERLIEPYMEKRIDFESYKSNICHRLKIRGDIDFIDEVLEKEEIEECWSKGWYPECFYLLAMIDYIGRINGKPENDGFKEIRQSKLKEPLFPASIQMLARLDGEKQAKEYALSKAIPEFLKFNIVELDVRKD